MKIIETRSMFERELGNIKALPVRHLNLNGYGDLAFECGCKEAHRIDGLDGAVAIFTSPPVKVFYVCPNGYVSFVHIKGIFSQTAITIFTGKKEIAEGLF
jgi:hypothetical protein